MRTIRDGDYAFGNDFNAVVSGFTNTGVESGCLVTQRAAGPNMSVDVAAGVVRVAGLNVAVVAANKVVSAADATNARYDLVVSDGAGVLSVVAGTASASPVAPDVPASSSLLALVRVPAASTTVTSANIFDARIILSALTGVFNIVASQAKPNAEGIVRWTKNTEVDFISPKYGVTRIAAANTSNQIVGNFMGDAQDTTLDDDLTAWDAGDKIEVAGFITFVGFADLNNNWMMGLGLGFFSMLKTDPSQRVEFGPANDGKIYLVAGTGSAVTVFDTGFVAVSGTRYRFKITFTKGTSVTLEINGVAATPVTTNLPTYIAFANLGSGQGATAANKTVTAHGATAWRFTPAI